MVKFLDFEFYKNFTTHLSPIILILGAISNGNEVIKLKGIPLVLEYDKSLPTITDVEIYELYKNIEKTFNIRKREYLQPVKNQIVLSLNSQINNLNAENIKKLIYNTQYYDDKPIVVTWNGSTVVEILRFLNIRETEYKHLDIMAIRHFGNNFNLYAYKKKQGCSYKFYR